MLLFIASEVMLFGSFFTAYFFIRVVNGTPWPTPGFHLPVFVAGINTAILLTSSATMHWAVQSIKRGYRRGLQAGLVLTFLMGLYFDLGQGYEYLQLVREQGLTLSSSAYGSVFYIPTGFHGLHVAGGLVAFIFLLGRTYAARTFTHEQQVSAIVVSYYWHFVDVVWIGLFTVIYLIH